MLVPLHGFLQGDSVGLLLLVQDTDTLARVARTMIDAAAVRVAPARQARVFRGGVELSLAETVASAGLIALERIDIVGEPPSSRRACVDEENEEMPAQADGHELAGPAGAVGASTPRRPR